METARRIEAWSTQGRHRWKDFRHDEVCLVWQFGGSSLLETRQGTGVADRSWLCPSSPLCLFPAKDYALIAARGGERFGMVLHLSDQDLWSVLDQEDAVPGLALTRPSFDDPGLRRRLAWLWQAQRSFAPVSAQKAARRSIAHALLEHEGRAPRLRGLRKFSPAMRRMIEDAIRESLAEDVGVEQLAALVGIGRSRFDALFHATFGTSMHKFLLKCRVEEASRIIRESDVPLQSVAALLGFGSSSQFSTTFRMLAGLSPREYRDHNRTRVVPIAAQ